MMPGEDEFDDLRPYYNNEINDAVKRILSNPLFETIMSYFFDEEKKKNILASLQHTDSHYAFQRDFTYPLVLSIAEKSTNGLTYEGLEKLDPSKPYLFVGNHRDIVLDAAFFQTILFSNGFPTTEITFGSNLMVNQFVVDLGKVNRMFKVMRGGNKKELLTNSQRLSAYIRHTIVNKRNSIWIAQRGGRTKDGNDKTETGLLKMFNMSSQGSPEDSLGELNIVPLSVSYEYEPCCASKINELQTTLLTGTYVKGPDEDLKSIITGITSQKGRVHFTIGKPLNESLYLLRNVHTLNGKITLLANIIDKELHKNYRLWPGNYIALDLLNNSDGQAANYTAGEKESFLGYMQKEIRAVAADSKDAKEMFLKIYANPLINFLKYA